MAFVWSRKIVCRNCIVRVRSLSLCQWYLMMMMNRRIENKNEMMKKKRFNEIKLYSKWTLCQFSETFHFILDCFILAAWAGDFRWNSLLSNFHISFLISFPIVFKRRQKLFLKSLQAVPTLHDREYPFMVYFEYSNGIINSCCCQCTRCDWVISALFM